MLLILRMAFLCQILTVLQAKHAENICEKRQSDAVGSSTNVQVVVTECLSMETVLMVIISEKSITENTFFVLLILLESRGNVLSV